MPDSARLQIDLIPHPVTLHYPGADGICFRDAVLCLGNPGREPAAEPALRLGVRQGDRTLLDGPVDLAALGVPAAVASGAEVRLSVFRILQRHAPGFGSKVNLFGYRAVLNWAFRVEAEFGAKAAAAVAGAWHLAWRPDADDPALVDVEIARL